MRRTTAPARQLSKTKTLLQGESSHCRGRWLRSPRSRARGRRSPKQATSNRWQDWAPIKNLSTATVKIFSLRTSKILFWKKSLSRKKDTASHLSTVTKKEGRLFPKSRSRICLSKPKCWTRIFKTWWIKTFSFQASKTSLWKAGSGKQ